MKMLVYILFNAVVIVIAFIGNFLVMLVVALDRHLHNMRNFLVSSLALSDFLTATLILDSRVVSVVHKKWIFGETACVAWACLARVLFFNTILHLCAASYERYRAIVKNPLSYDGRITTKKIILSISVPWILPTVVSLSPFVGFGAFEYNPKVYACVHRRENDTAFPYLVIWYIVPLSIIFVLNYQVIKVARRLERKVNVQLGETNNPGDGETLQLGQFTTQREINWQLQDEANIKDGEQQNEHQKTGEEIVEDGAGEDPFKLWKKTLHKAWQVNVGDELSEFGAVCSQERSSQHGNIIHVQYWPEDDSQQTTQPGTPVKPICSHFQSLSPCLDKRGVNTGSPAVVQRGNPETASGTKGLLKILKECKAARDTLIMISGLLVCLLPVWVNNIYYHFKGELPGSAAIFWVSSLYGTTTICNPIVHSVRKKEFRKAARKMFKI